MIMILECPFWGIIDLPRISSLFHYFYTEVTSLQIDVFTWLVHIWSVIIYLGDCNQFKFLVENFIGYEEYTIVFIFIAYPFLLLIAYHVPDFRIITPLFNPFYFAPRISQLNQSPNLAIYSDLHNFQKCVCMTLNYTTHTF